MQCLSPVSYTHLFNETVECRQAVYTNKEKLSVSGLYRPDGKPMPNGLIIRKLDADDIQEAAPMYPGFDNPDYIVDRIEAGAVYGAFLSDNTANDTINILAGIIGIHEEGSIGMLYVKPEYRHRKLATALETYAFNRALENGWIPYGQIIVGNEASMRLQESMGLHFSKSSVYWICLLYTSSIIEDLQRKVKEQHIKEPAECKELLIESIKEQMKVEETAYRFENEKSVVLVIGVNGVGKTTTVGKLAGKLKEQGKKVVIAGADTFRAAAGDQLKEWANRAGVDMIGGAEGADPGAVVYDAVAASKARNADVLLVDTAGRLHNKKNLMNELGKINKILESEYPDAYRETLVVLDATTGQNALVQAREFSDVAKISGIVLTKMDGTAKGGIAVAIQSELSVPVKYIGIGETIDDLQKFDSDEFVNALFDTKTE